MAILGNTEPTGIPKPTVLTGDPQCPICAGVGFYRRDLPIDDPDFGRLLICVCSQNAAENIILEGLRQRSNLAAFSDKTFETFDPQGRVGLEQVQSNSLEYAHSMTIQFARSMEGWLLLLGGYGCGKTHLAAAIANHAVGQGVATLFQPVPDLLDWLRFGYGREGTSFEERFEEIRNMPLLVLDDLGTQNATPWSQEKLFQIINHRYVNRLPTVITSNQELVDVEGRARSRLEDPDLVIKVRISAPDYRAPMQEGVKHAQVSALADYSKYTFGNFSLREAEKLSQVEKQSLSKAFKTAQGFAERPQGWLVLMGPTFTGKTHLAAAIGNYARTNAEGAPVFVEVIKLLDHLRATFHPSSPRSYDRVFDEVLSTPLLILDALGTENATSWAREKLYQIFSHRYVTELPTVITMGLTMDDLEKQDPRIFSRMGDARLCRIHKLLVPRFPTTAEPPKSQRKRRA